MKLKRCKILIVLALILTLTISSTVFASPINQASSSSVQAKIDDIEANIEQMDEHIMTLMDELKDTNDKIAQKKAEISNIQKEIDDSNNGIKAQEDLYKQRIRALYMSGMADSYLQVLAASTSFSDFISRIDTVITIMKYDSKLIEGLKEKKHEISLKKEALMKENDALLALQDADKKKLAELDQKKDKQKELLAELNIQKRQIASTEDKAAIYQAYNNAVNNSSGDSKLLGSALASRGASSSSGLGGEIVAYSMKYLGTPYVWGGTTPSGFDCSGFTKYVFSHFGITLNRISRDQATQGVEVSTDSLEPGDLIFFGSPVYHVGIYAGNGMMVHAPHTGDVVRIASVYWSNVSQVRRIR